MPIQPLITYGCGSARSIKTAGAAVESASLFISLGMANDYLVRTKEGVRIRLHRELASLNGHSSRGWWQGVHYCSTEKGLVVPKNAYTVFQVYRGDVMCPPRV